ncbi:GRIM-19 [Piptocephalis cylindrospora]|uniref:NADH dehydrogenase [ubiquinone] 1 alpha subcomplex subunit 13 n=1 Tax=Piptocephalis cylindrospora TaxID=1907219 RepID=A0A4P9Y7H2_9FUNG|nr:GRIM-19 [Piptocephalis cylindrospora]|eukprot:RKP14684.1 GRIM-19 [Piptocephalis cylindrospora]
MNTPIQEMPPTGGFKPIRYKRFLPKKGPSGLTLAVSITSIMAYGFYRVMEGRRETFELQREKLWGRIYLVPFLQAETDRDVYRRTRAQEEREAWAMQGVPNWKVGESAPAYKATKRHIPTNTEVDWL